jgi:hypothetical protein
MIGRRVPKNRRFSYEPRYYDPKKEEREGRRIKFKRTRTRAQARSRSLIWLITLLFLIIYLILFFNQMRRRTEDRLPEEGQISESILPGGRRIGHL